MSHQNPQPSRKTCVTRVPDHFSSRGRWTITTLRGTAFQERQRESTSAGASQNHAPPPNPCEFCAGTECGRFLTSLRPGELTEESLWICGPPASHFTGENDQSSSFLWRACRNAAPSSRAQRLWGVPSLLRGDTSVVSTAICTP